MTTKRYSLAALALTLLALAACRQDDGLGTDNGSDGTLPVTLGQIAIGGSSTRLSTANPDAWETGDLIRVSAPGTNGNPVTATYKYNAAATVDARWTQIDPARTDDPDAAHATGDTYPLYLESLGATGTGSSGSGTDATTLETWGGSAGWSGSTDYLNQSTPAAYRLNDYLRCPAATRALAGTGASRTCQLSGTLSHQRVSLVLKVADGGTYSNRLPQDAVLRLYLTDGDATTTLGRRLTAWREGKTDASGTPGSSSYVPATTTFRALVALEDVPGIVMKADGPASGSTSNATCTVTPGSVLGEMTYTDRGTRQTQYITYSVKSAPAGSTDADGNALIAAGTRITVTATFKDAPYTPTPPPTPPTEPDVTITGTATLAAWDDTDLGDVGTEEKQDLQLSNETGTNGSPIYEVYTAKGLKAFAKLVNGTGSYNGAQSLAANARLMTNIDLSSVCGEGKDSWEPMANGESNGSSSNHYAGTFDGQGHTISGLYISSSSQYAGLFGYVGTNGKVQNLRVEAGTIIMKNGSPTGALAGYNGGTITDCRVTGSVLSMGTLTTSAGGFVGENYGTITDCYITGTVSGSNSNSIGGLVGSNYGTITACYATGAISGGAYVGGLVGYNCSTITACYATGAVSNAGGHNDTGGLVGKNIYGTITACYATGDVTSSSTGGCTGGFAGYNDSGTNITDCFWQKGANGTPTAGIGDGTTSGDGIILTEITGQNQYTWAGVVGKYEAPVTGSTSTLNASIHTWNTSFPQGNAKYCGYRFEKNLKYQSAEETPNEAPLLLTPIKENQ